MLCVLKVREWAFPVELPHARWHGRTSLLGMRWDWGNYGLLRPFFLSGPPLRRTRDVDGEEGATKRTNTIPVTALSSPRRKCGATGKGSVAMHSTCSSSTSFLASYGRELE